MHSTFQFLNIIESAIKKIYIVCSCLHESINSEFSNNLKFVVSCKVTKVFSFFSFFRAFSHPSKLMSYIGLNQKPVQPSSADTCGINRSHVGELHDMKCKLRKKAIILIVFIKFCFACFTRDKFFSPFRSCIASPWSWSLQKGPPGQKISM